MLKLFRKLKYPKFTLLIISFLFAYLFFILKDLSVIRNFVSSSGYLGAFISGIMFSYGFTAGLSTACFLILGQSQNILLTGLIGGLGALAGDFIVFKFIRLSFEDEIKKLSEEKIFYILTRDIPEKIKNTALIILASAIIASPLPDELGVFMLATATKLSSKLFALLSYLLNTGGILIILLIGQSM